MRAASMGFVLLPLLANQIAWAQASQPQTTPAQTTPAVEDFRPASSNQGGKEYPQVNSERRARFRVVAPQAQSVRVPEWGGVTLTKGEDGSWVGTTRPLDEGFHYYQDQHRRRTPRRPGPRQQVLLRTLAAGASAIRNPGPGRGLPMPSRDIPHGQLRQSMYFSQGSTNSHARVLRLHAARL